MNTETGSTIVLGAAVGYTVEQMAPFLRSLRSAGYTGDVALIVEPSLARSAPSPLFDGVTLLPARQWLPVRLRLFRDRRRWALVWLWQPLQSLAWLLLRVLAKLPVGAALRSRLQIPVALWLFPPTETRYIRFLRFLESHTHARVLLCDVRDVVFQRNPFEDLPGAGLAVSMEAPQNTVQGERHNAEWVRKGYGQEMLRLIGSRQVSCSGVTYGDRASILRYLSSMTAEILKLNREAAGSSGMDQGIHNVLIWTQSLGEFHCLETLESPVATLGAVDAAELRFDPAGRLLNRDGSLISVVHQYDRVASLRETLPLTLTRAPLAA